MTFGLRHLIAALVLHALLFAILLGGLQCSRKPVKPPVIRAVLLDPDRKEVAQQKRREEQRRQEERRQAELEKKQQQEEERRRLVEEQKRQEAVALKKKQEDEARRQQELAEQKKAEEQARRKKELAEQKEREDQAKRELQEQARIEEEMRREAMRRDLEREQNARAATERELKTAQWIDTLSRHIAKNWVRPSSTVTDFECQVRVQQLPDGQVTFARIVKSCGNSPLDKSVEDAVFRSSPLPRPTDPSIFDRDLVITFIPES
jgi:colicin import membrane protein